MQSRSSHHNQALNDAGFTTFESIVVFMTIAVLLGFIAYLILADKRIADTRNAERASDIQTLLDATYQYAIDHNGVLPASIPLTEQEICRESSADCTDLVNLDVLIDEGLLHAIPIDPTENLMNGTGYTIVRSTTGRVTVSAPHAEWGVTISESL